MGDVNNQYDFFKEVNVDSNGNLGVVVTGGGVGGNTIYTADDSLTGNRIVDLNSNTLTFSNGNVLVTGTVDGRDISTDGAKLDTISTNADVTLDEISAGTNITISPTGVISSSGGGTTDTLYTADGTLSGNRTVDLNSNDLKLVLVDCGIYEDEVDEIEPLNLGTAWLYASNIDSMG